MAGDKRTDIYHDLHSSQLTQQEAATHHSATQVLKMFREFAQPNSMLDVGCGLGIWLKVAQEIGISDVLGVEGPWIESALLNVPTELIKRLDLEKPVSLGRRFDVVVCSEVGEHLSPASAGVLIDSLVGHSDYILYSAAIPFQGGHHHVNEQFLPYWVNHFARHDYVLLDVFRARIWDDPKILWWLKQNLVLFAKRSTAEANPALRDQIGVKRPVSIVHPDIYFSRLQSGNQMASEYNKLIGLLQQGGQFTVTKGANNQMTIARTA
jgi:hypothetical protein